MKPYFSIIIPTLNEEVHLPVLLESLSTQTFRGFEVIVGDCGSSDATEEKAGAFTGKLPRLFFTSQSAHSIGAARNYGAKHAKGKYFIFLDADTNIEQTFLEGVKQHIEKDKVNFFTLWNRNESRNWMGTVVFALLNSVVTLFSHLKPSVNGPCMIVERGLFSRVGGFDPDVIFGEDSDFAQKVHHVGEKLRVYQKPIIYGSTRRFEKDGFVKSAGKSIYAFVYGNIFGPIKKPIFDYEMGGQYYKKNQRSKIKDQNYGINYFKTKFLTFFVLGLVLLLFGCAGKSEEPLKFVKVKRGNILAIVRGK